MYPAQGPFLSVCLLFQGFPWFLIQISPEQSYPAPGFQSHPDTAKSWSDSIENSHHILIPVMGQKLWTYEYPWHPSLSSQLPLSTCTREQSASLALFLGLHDADSGELRGKERGTQIRIGKNLLMVAKTRNRKSGCRPPELFFNLYVCSHGVLFFLGNLSYVGLCVVHVNLGFNRTTYYLLEMY